MHRETARPIELCLAWTRPDGGPAKPVTEQLRDFMTQEESQTEFKK